MIKFVIAALWISLATTGALVYAFNAAQETPADGEAAGEPDAFHGLDYVKTGVISVPVFEEGKVHGYFLARLVFTAKAARLKELKLPAEALLADQVYTQLFASPEIDFVTRTNFDVDVFRKAIRTGVNSRLGEDLIEEVLVEQVDYLPKDDTKATSLSDTESAMSVDAAMPAEEAESGH